MVRWEIWKYLLEYIASYVCSGWCHTLVYSSDGAHSYTTLE